MKKREKSDQEKAALELAFDRAQNNFFALSLKTYPGRIMIVGITPDNKHAVVIYAIMGRSDGSKSRYFTSSQKSKNVRVLPLDPENLTPKEKSLMIYTAVMDDYTTDYSSVWVAVSNGRHTRLILVEGLSNLSSSSYKYEPDNASTPRIGAEFRIRSGKIHDFKMGILKKSPFNKKCDAHFFELNSHPGFGYCIHTYNGEGGTKSFEGEPYTLPIDSNDIGKLADKYWEVLDENNRVSLVVKFYDLQTGKPAGVKIINKNEVPVVKKKVKEVEA